MFISPVLFVLLSSSFAFQPDSTNNPFVLIPAVANQVGHTTRTIRGKCLIAQSGDPLGTACSDVALRFVDSKGKVIVSTQTNRIGEFELRVSRDAKLFPTSADQRFEVRDDSKGEITENHAMLFLVPVRRMP